MEEAMKKELARMREEDDKWTGPKLLVVAVVTLICAFTTIYTIASIPSASW
ncbi:MAG: hypothetical protein ACKO6N_02205 [Myxococcota bacterium]